MRLLICIVIAAILATASAQFDTVAPVPGSPCYTPDAGQACNGNGICLNSTNANSTSGQMCKCDNGWGRDDCSYEEKSQILVFLMSFFFGGLGVDRFILGLTGSAVGKLILGLAGCILPCVAACVAACAGIGAGEIGAGLVGGIAACLLICAIFAAFGWWLHDVIVIGLNHLADSNGFPMKSW